MSRTMILIHGAWLASNSWDDFGGYFSARGWDVQAPEWPRKHDGVAAQNEDSDELAGLGITEIVDHYEAIIRALPAPPVIVGHSFGGLFTQLLLDRGLGVAGVALDPAPAKGILLLEPSELKAAGPALNHPSKRKGVVTLTFEQFNYAFTNTWDEAEARAAYEQYAVPETGRILFESGFANFAPHSTAKVDYGNQDRAPLLITAAEHDNTVPKGVARSAYEHHVKHTAAITDFVEFPDRPHLLLTGPGWQEVAEHVEGWLAQQLDGAPAPAAPAAGASA